MDTIWKELYEAAKAVQHERRISEYVTGGEVAAAILSRSGKIYTGVCIDTCSTLGICAERNALRKLSNWETSPPPGGFKKTAREDSGLPRLCSLL